MRTASTANYFVPSIDLSGAWTDNITLARPGLEKSGEIYDAAPSLLFTHDSPREHATFNYRLDALYFSGGSHDFLHSGALLSRSDIVSDWLELDVNGQRTQGAANPALPANNAYLFPTANLANFTSGMASAILQHPFGPVLVNASYSYGLSRDDAVSASSAPAYSSTAKTASFTMSSSDPNDRLTWSANYSRADDRYEDPYSQRLLFEQAIGELGLHVTSDLRLIARGGKESNIQSTGVEAGGLGATLWAAGFDWTTAPRDELMLLVGHRYFGRTYTAVWNRQSRFLTLSVSYNEQPTTEDAILMQTPLSLPVVPNAPAAPGLTRLSPDIFLDKSLIGSATITGRLTEIGLSVTSETRTYYAVAGMPDVSQGKDRDRAVALSGTRRLGPTLDLTLSASYAKYDFRDTTGFPLWEYSAALLRHIGRRSSLSLRLERLQQSGGAAGGYRADIVRLDFSTAFANPPPTATAFPTRRGYLPAQRNPGAGYAP